MARIRSLIFKELSKKDSNQKIKELLKERIILQAKKHYQPGMLILTSYRAKNAEVTYDKTPLILILKRGIKHTLAINFHWLPVSRRMYLIKHIIDKNKSNIKMGKPIEFSYAELKPMLKSLGYAPCIRLYINSRLGRQGIPLPPERIGEVARMKAETFTNGKYSASQLFQMAKKRGQNKSKKKKYK